MLISGRADRAKCECTCTRTLDLTDSGATVLLPSYVVDVWVSGSDAAGNPFDTIDNSINTPIASWPLALVGPSMDFSHEDTRLSWSNPSPVEGSAVNLNVMVLNQGGKGDVAFVLQRAVEGRPVGPVKIGGIPGPERILIRRRHRVQYRFLEVLGVSAPKNCNNFFLYFFCS